MTARLTYASRRRVLALSWGGSREQARMRATLPDMPVDTVARASTAGKASAAAKTPEQRQDAARHAANGAHRPEVLAERIGKAWEGLDEDRRRAIRATLRKWGVIR